MTELAEEADPAGSPATTSISRRSRSLATSWVGPDRAKTANSNPTSVADQLSKLAIAANLDDDDYGEKRQAPA